MAARYDFSRAIPLEEVAADVEEMLRHWQVQITHPRYLGLFNPSVTFASVVADALVATYNPQLAAWRTAPAPNEIERHTLGWLTTKFGLPSNAIATFTSGGAEANLSAVVTALTHAFPDYGDDGLRSLTATPVIYLSAEAHHSFSKIAHIVGLGRKSVRVVPADSDLKMSSRELASKISEDRANGFAPLMVVGTAGTTAAGAIDPLQEIAKLCRDEGMWFHADAAWGGAAILSPSLRNHIAGIEFADSITCDAHKWFSVSMACGMFFCRHPETVARAFRAAASYMPGSAGSTTFDPYTNSVQWSRRFTGLKLFMSLAERGESGQAAMIEHQSRMGEILRESLSAAGWRIVNNTPLPVVCFTRDGLDVASLLADLRQEQTAWMSEVQINGSSAVRACITSFKTTEAEIQDIVRDITRLIAK
ncbi:pyridoxal phosphate-dependent decarboxylase family protein [Terracidiphilus sp.]|uniref:pyridoxal phosphate-dependent decarboxylase family protein n=1 Tax=Terracidiphilus sp. TaxID=1964191 RepID=UPI003C785F6C